MRIAIMRDEIQVAKPRRLLDSVNRLAVAPIVEKVAKDVAAFTGNAPPQDDVTLFALRYLG